MVFLLTISSRKSGSYYLEDKGFWHYPKLEVGRQFNENGNWDHDSGKGGHGDHSYSAVFNNSFERPNGVQRLLAFTLGSF